MNDFHGHLLPEPQSFANGARVGGAAELAAYFDRDRAEFTAGPTIILDGGDVMQGTPLSNLVGGRSSVDFFNAIGVSAGAIGNHEFDWGQPALRDRIAQAKHPWLAANIRVAGTDTAPSWAKPTAVINAGGVRIGIIGLITEATPQTTQLRNITNLSFTDGAAEIDRWVPVMRRQNVDFVIVVAHSGGSCDADGKNCHGEIIDWATHAHEKPDLIVAGHSHAVVQTYATGVPIVEAGSYGNRYNVVDLTHVHRGRDTVESRILPLRVVYADSIRPKPSIVALVAAVRAEVGPEIDRVIANASSAISRDGGESPLGRLIADGWRYATNAQVALMQTGGIRGGIDAGPITWGELFSVHPFGGRVIVLKLSGANLREAIEHGVAGSTVLAQVSGITADYDTSKPDGSRVTNLCLEDGTPIRDDAVYTVAVSDILATGQGDGFTSLGRFESQTDTGIIELNALINYVQHLGIVTPPMQPRLHPVGR